ncbi:MAG: acyl-CoA thioesterase/BAAT N-terminal domain-containing protein [Actinomycetota bacterium]|nr:acyl-CoA thioesterase/BAAT N-terminal domain-containing protein [Actinomycetota bacterium]
MQLDRTVRLDEPLALTLTDLPEDRPVRVELRAGTDPELSWWARFDSGPRGTISTDTSASQDGSYLGCDPYGLWWSMPATARSGSDPLADQLIEVTADCDSVRRRFSILRKGIPDTVEVSVAAAIPSGTLFTPATRPAATVIVLGGSGGGQEPARTIAAMLAARGARALGLAYFGSAGLTAELDRVPIEIVGDAVTHLAGLAGEPVHLVSVSRGAELALQVASRYPGIASVTAIACSAISWPGLTRSRQVVPAWTWHGEPLPYAVPGSSGGAVSSTADGLCFTPLYNATLDEPASWQHAAIEVDRIAGELLLVSGGDDQLWPSGRFAELIGRRRTGRADRHLHFPDAGHGIGRPPGLPASEISIRHPGSGLGYCLGGSRAANAAAGASWWKALVDMLGLDQGGLL